jgi:hypothetical protein
MRNEITEAPKDLYVGKSFSVFAAYSCLISWKGDKIQQLMTSTLDLQLFEIIKKSWGGPV